MAEQTNDTSRGTTAPIILGGENPRGEVTGCPTGMTGLTPHGDGKPATDKDAELPSPSSGTTPEGVASP
jgi:hypothetical protein